MNCDTTDRLYFTYGDDTRAYSIWKLLLVTWYCQEMTVSHGEWLYQCFSIIVAAPSTPSTSYYLGSYAMIIDTNFILYYLLHGRRGYLIFAPASSRNCIFYVIEHAGCRTSFRQHLTSIFWHLLGLTWQYLCGMCQELYNLIKIAIDTSNLIWIEDNRPIVILLYRQTIYDTLYAVVYYINTMR